MLLLLFFLFVVCCLLFVVCCLLFVVCYCFVVVVLCLLIIVFCLLFLLLAGSVGPPGAVSIVLIAIAVTASLDSFSVRTTGHWPLLCCK